MAYTHGSIITSLFLSPVYTAQTNPGSTRVSFCRVNAANPGSTRVKSNPPLEVGSTVRVEPGLVWKSVVLTKTWVEPGLVWVLHMRTNFVACLTQTPTRVFKTIDLITEYNNFTWECNQLACVRKTNPDSPLFVFTRVFGFCPCEQSRVEPGLVCVV